MLNLIVMLVIFAIGICLLKRWIESCDCTRCQARYQHAHKH